jgi:hypothetical protein
MPNLSTILGPEPHRYQLVPTYWPCPRCHGCGHLDDGLAIWTTTATFKRPASRCAVCGGSGRVTVSPTVR